MIARKNSEKRPAKGTTTTVLRTKSSSWANDGRRRLEQI